jgi:hypothetical protein
MENLAPNKTARQPSFRVVRWTLAALAVIAIALFGAGATGVAFGQTSVTDALYSIALNITNTTASQKDDIQVPFTLSTASLIDDGFITSDALNSVIQRGSVDVPAMPGTNRIVVKGAAQDDGGVFTDYTAEAQDSTSSDVVLLPTTPATDDAFYLGFDIPAGMSTVDIDVAGVGTWAITWEYYNGSSWAALSDVDDRTSAFSIIGRNIVIWTVPADWAASTVVSISAYWVRARVSSFSSITTQPLGSLIQYETGDWWSWVETLPLDTQEQLTLSLGGEAKRTYHEIFSGSAGITTSDAAGLEPGSTFSLAVRGRSHFETLGSSSCYVCKSGVISLYPSASGEITATVTGASTTTLTLSTLTLPDTGSQNVILASDGTDLALWADAGAGMVTGDTQTITDNASDWTWGSSGAVDYSDAIAYDAATGDVISVIRSYAEWVTGSSTNTQAYTSALGLANGS